MDKILLILSTTRKSDKCIKDAVDIASKENAKLIILFVVDNEVPQKIFDSLTEEGWIGGKRLRTKVLSISHLLKEVHF
jgi:hypothetical protein